MAGAKVGGLGFRPLVDGVGDLPLGRAPWGTVKYFMVKVALLSVISMFVRITAVYLATSFEIN